MKRAFFVALLLLGTAGSVARADPVSYSTTWDTSIDPTSRSFLNTTNLAFEGVTRTVDAPVISSAVGYFSVTSFWGGTETFTNVPFDLVITQTAPLAQPNSGVFSSILSGRLSWNNSTLDVMFDNPSVQIGNVTYTLTKQSYDIVGNDGWSAGKTEIDAAISMAGIAAPEPASLLLLGSGLVLLALVIRRRVPSGNVSHLGVPAP